MFPTFKSQKTFSEAKFYQYHHITTTNITATITTITAATTSTAPQPPLLLYLPHYYHHHHTTTAAATPPYHYCRQHLHFHLHPTAATMTTSATISTLISRMQPNIRKRFLWKIFSRNSFLWKIFSKKLFLANVFRKNKQSVSSSRHQGCRKKLVEPINRSKQYSLVRFFRRQVGPHSKSSRTIDYGSAHGLKKNCIEAN